MPTATLPAPAAARPDHEVVFVHGVPRIPLVTGKKARIFVKRKKKGMAWRGKPRPPCESFTVRCEDGGVLKGERFPATRPDAPVFLLFHGAGCTHRMWESLGRALVHRGAEVWMPNLRGHGPDSHHSLPGSDGCSFDEIIGHDLPALFDHVASTTGRRVHAIGHSMGALALHAYRHGAERFAGGMRLSAATARERADTRIASAIESGRPGDVHKTPKVFQAMFFAMGLVKHGPEYYTMPDITPDEDFGPLGTIRKLKVLGKLFDAGLTVGLFSAYHSVPPMIMNKLHLSFAFFKDMIETDVSRRVHRDVAGDIERYVREGFVSRPGPTGAVCDYEHGPGKISYVENVGVVGGPLDMCDIDAAIRIARRYAADPAAVVSRKIRLAGHMDSIFGPGQQVVLELVSDFAGIPGICDCGC